MSSINLAWTVGSVLPIERSCAITSFNARGSAAVVPALPRASASVLPARGSLLSAANRGSVSVVFEVSSPKLRRVGVPAAIGGAGAIEQPQEIIVAAHKTVHATVLDAK